MKIEQLVVQHFYNNREVTLQGMGTFKLSDEFVPPKENDKDVEIPENAISFQYDPKAVADDALIGYIVQQTRKMRSLAAADLDSYLVLGKQFLNIGKPFKIEGMGMLIKNQEGRLEFSKGHAFFAKMETTASPLKEHRDNPEISFASETRHTTNNKKGILMAAAAVVLLALAGTTVWYFLSRKNNNGIETASSTAVPATDTVKTQADTLAVKPVAQVMPPADGYTFKVVFLKTSDSAAAVSRMNTLTARHHTVIMYKKDSVNFALAEPFKLPLADTAHIRDSLNRFYYSGKAFIELQ